MLLAAAALLTLLLAYRTFWYLLHSVTNVPYSDQWTMLEEIRRAREHQSGWGYLWSPYWGQRLLLPRLLFLLSTKYLHYYMRPFVLLNVTVQVSMIVVLIGKLRKLFHNSSTVFWVSSIALIHLLLSSLQMEILVEGIEIQYTIGYASAVVAICVLGGALDPNARFEPRFWSAILLGVMSTACLAIGPLVWPALIVEAWLSKARRKHHLVILSALTFLVASAYIVGYTRPEIGMGFTGLIRHPISGLSIIALVLGGPVSLYSRSLGMVAGGAGIAIICGILIYFWRKRSPEAPAISLIIVACFMIGSAASIAIGRLSPEWLASYSGQLLPSRYLAPTFVFWAALFAVSLSCRNSSGLGRVALGVVSVVVLILTFGTWNWQWRMPPAWASISQGFDAIGSGFILSVSDQEFMSRVFSDVDSRDRLVGYMQQQHLSVFAEPRATWIGQEMTTVARGDNGKNCHATVTATPVGGAQASLRVVGMLTIDGRPPPERLDILITDDQQRIAGLARTLPAQSQGKQATDFFGYARRPEQDVLLTSRFFVLFPDRRSCAVHIP
jgi:hypothetical protein